MSQPSRRSASALLPTMVTGSTLAGAVAAVRLRAFDQRGARGVIAGHAFDQRALNDALVNWEAVKGSLVQLAEARSKLRD